uniref:Transcription initiation factor TFIID subunit 12 n=1 Tax=Amblyomma triste TaxID=251400 RepID=A0A023G6J3_AMBTT
MASIPSSVVATTSIYTTTVPLCQGTTMPLCQGTVENHQLCATSTVTLPIQVTIPPVVAHTVVQPTPALSGTITVPAVTPTVTPITSSAASVGVATACAPALTTTLVKTVVPTNLPERHVNTGDGVQVLNKQRLQDLVKEVDPNEQLDDDVEELLLQVADDFIENVVTTSCRLAKHRKSNVLEAKDVQLSLEKNWNMWIPGFGAEELQPYKKASSTEAHKQRMALIRKTLKKY